MNQYARTPVETLIRAMMTCGDDEGVCEVCAAVQERKHLTTMWIERGDQEEGYSLCRDCLYYVTREAKGGA
jgi:hypothetical protein